tara:strand:- start:1646 stop:1837 length:192 start_codon:yes stop_codon:yes gene_type:complete
MDNISQKIMTEKEFYETYKHPERVKVFNITRVRCECGRVVLLKGIRRHEKQGPHLAYLDKKAS